MIPTIENRVTGTYESAEINEDDHKSGKHSGIDELLPTVPVRSVSDAVDCVLWRGGSRGSCILIQSQIVDRQGVQQLIVCLSTGVYGKKSIIGGMLGATRA